MLGIKINLGKNTLIDIGVEDSLLRNLADVVGCGIRKLPFSYLGMLVGGNPKTKSFWTAVVERRLAGWGRSYLSIGGRVTLKKAVLANLPYIICLSLRCQKEW